MNGVRSISMRKGYLLTALAAAVLLAASSGTAYAQSIGFRTTSATVMEGASGDKDTAAPVAVNITISGLTLDGDDANGEDGLGEITLVHNADAAYPGKTEVSAGENLRIWIDGESSAFDETRTDLIEGAANTPLAGKYGLPTGGEIHYDRNGVIKLLIIDPAKDGNWIDNKFTMDIRTVKVGVSPSPGSARVTVVDTDAQPTVSFSRANVSLTEDSQTVSPLSIELGAGKDGTDDDPGQMSELTNTIRFTTSPADAAVETTCADDAVIALELVGITEVMDEDDTWEITGNAGEIADGATIGITACGDMSGYRDEMVTFSFVDESLTGTTAAEGMVGDLAVGPDLVVTVQSEGEDPPEVSFATTSIDMDEGGTNTVAILADGELGTEVGSVMVSMSGDAMLSLWQGDDMLEAGAGGMFEVMLGTADKPSANTILTISADSDRALEDGMTSSATLTIESASGATIGGRDSLTVTVTGSTACCGASAARSVAPGPVPDGRRRAAVSSAQRIAPSS